MNRLYQLKTFLIKACFSIVIVCAIKAPAANEKPIQIPLNFTAQRPVLKVMIDDKGPYRFIFDTGSSANIIDTELAKELELQVVGADTMYSPGSQKSHISTRVKVPRLNFPGTEFSGEALMGTLDIRKMVDVDGIISAGFFEEYLLTISYIQEKLILLKDELDSTNENVIPYSQSQGIINLNINVDGQSLEAHLDSGNPGEFDLPYALKDKLKFSEEPVDDGVIQTATARFKKWRATLNGRINIGNIVFENPQIHLVENFPYANLGARFLKKLNITIDKKNSLIKFEKATTAIVKEEESAAAQNAYAGNYGERRIFSEKGQLYLQRDAVAKLKLEKIKDDLYKMTLNMPVMNELPHVRFERDKNKKVTGLTFIFKDGREEFVKKDD